MNPNVINGDTGVSLYVLIGTFPLLLGCVLVWLQVRAMRKDIKRAWSLSHQRIWAERLGSHNSKLSLEIPDPDDVVKTVNGKL